MVTEVRAGRRVLSVSVLFVVHDVFAAHDTGPWHPERAERLSALRAGLEAADLGEALVEVPAPLAPLEAVLSVHQAPMVERVRLACAAGVDLDPDTRCVPPSWEAAQRAAGAGLEAVARLDAGPERVAFCAVRPPGHHATTTTPMGFCLFNNVAVTARALADRGERVLIADIDAHHGNGTQDAFYDDPRVLFVSWHQWPLYPGTGAINETGMGPGEGTTINIPLPPGTTGDVYRDVVERVVAPAVEEFQPTWLLVSAGFDAHRDDPLTSMGLTSGDYADVLADLLDLTDVPVVAFLEGGYDLGAVGAAGAATIGVLAGERLHPERPTSGGPGKEAVARVVSQRHRR